MTFTIFWESRCVSGNPRVNPNVSDRNVVLCAGWTKVEATSQHEAIELYQRNFSEDYVVMIK